MPKVANKPAICPFTVIVDTREQQPYTFLGLKADHKRQWSTLFVPTIRKCLPVGDYSVVDYESRVVVERKSKSDLWGSVGRRSNFERRLERMSEQFDYAAVVIEAELSEILNDPPNFSTITPKNLNRTILAWRQRYAVDWWFVPGRAFGEAYTFRILERFFRDATR